jgi:nucleotide-binding universal stress UspA family protein
MTSRVVIGYDGSEASEDAVAFGLTWCRSTGDVPIVATVYPEESALGVGRVDVEWASYVREQAQIIQDNARATVGDAALYRNVASTSAAHGLADLAEDVEAVLVIVGTAQETGLTRALLGSSTERLLHGATVPVTVVPPGWRKSAPDQISRIGVAYIDTREAREALRMAVRVALRIPAQLTLYTVLGQSSERYSYLVGRTAEQRSGTRRVTPSAQRWSLLRRGCRQSSNREWCYSRERWWSRLLPWVRTMSTFSSVALEAMAQSAGSCLVVSHRG